MPGDAGAQPVEDRPVVVVDAELADRAERAVGVHAERCLRPVARPGVLRAGVERGPGEVEPDRAARRRRTVLASSRVSSRSVWALPSKPPQASLSSASTRSPLCPNGGWPRSWASAAVSAMSGWLPSARDRSRATCATSRLWVSRLRTKSSLCGPTTWVLAASRREAAACTTRARSRSKGVRSGASTRLGGSSTRRSRAAASYRSRESIGRRPYCAAADGAPRTAGQYVVDVHVVHVVGGGRPAVCRSPASPRRRAPASRSGPTR